MIQLLTQHPFHVIYVYRHVNQSLENDRCHETAVCVLHKPTLVYYYGLRLFSVFRQNEAADFTLSE